MRYPPRSEAVLRHLGNRISPEVAFRISFFLPAKTSGAVCVAFVLSDDDDDDDDDDNLSVGCVLEGIRI